MKRREFIALLASSAAWSRVARAQQPAPVIGLLTAIDMADWAANGVRDGLGEAGYAEGRNLTIITRSAEGHFDRLPALAADLVKTKVAVILDEFAGSGARRKGRHVKHPDRVRLRR